LLRAEIRLVAKLVAIADGLDIGIIGDGVVLVARLEADLAGELRGRGGRIGR